MEKIQESFFINRKSGTIYSHTIWCRRFIKDITPQETESIILHDLPEVFINDQRNSLTPIPEKDIESFWNSNCKNHIADPENCTLQKFERGYCYTAELWKRKYGKKVLIFKYHH